MGDWGGYNSGDVLWLGEWGVGWLVALGALGVLVLALSWLDLRTMAARRRRTLLALRAAVYLLALGLLLEPAVDLKHISRVKNKVLVLIDSSASMTLGSDDPATSRHERAVAVVKAMAGRAERDRDAHEFELLRFGGPTLEPTTREGLRATTPKANSTDLLGALNAARERASGQEIGGVVLISDGTDTGALGRRVRAGEALDDGTKAALARLGAPVNTVAVARAEGLHDVAISRVIRDDFAFVHNKVSVRAEVQVIGMGELRVPITLKREGQPLQTREIAVTPERTRYEVEFELVPRRIGKEIYTISAPEYKNEALASNNTATFLLKIIRDKIRVLQVVGRPSWDERFLRRLLKRNPNVDLVSFFILRTDSNVQRAEPEQLSLIPFPTEELFEEELGSFDLIIFQDFNFGPYDVRQYLTHIAKFVLDGGGFAMIGGDLSFSSGGYAGTSIERLLPVRLPPTGPREMLVHEAPFRPQLTPAGQRHPITQLAFDPQTNQEIWAGLPKLDGTNIVLGARPQATTLLTHPTLKVGGQPMPVLSIWERGKGRALALTVDASWRWGFTRVAEGGTPREYQMFWNNAIRWLIRDPELRLIKIEVPQDTWSPDAPVSLDIRVSNPDYSPAAGARGTLQIHTRSLEAVAKGEDTREQQPAIPFTTTASGTARVTFTPTKPGVYELRASVKRNTETLADEDTILVIPEVREHRDIIPRDDLLGRLAEASSGRAIDATRFDADALELRTSRAVRVNRRKVIQLWDSFALFALILGLLSAEWILRRRWGRL